MDKAKSMPKTRDAVLPLIVGHASGVLRRLYVMEQLGLIACCDTEAIA